MGKRKKKKRTPSYCARALAVQQRSSVCSTREMFDLHFTNLSPTDTRARAAHTFVRYSSSFRVPRLCAHDAYRLYSSSPPSPLRRARARTHTRRAVTRPTRVNGGDGGGERPRPLPAYTVPHTPGRRADPAHTPLGRSRTHTRPHSRRRHHCRRVSVCPNV